MQLTTYLRALRKNWWIILLLMVIGAAAGVFRNVEATPVYATTTTFYVSTPGANTSQSQFADQQFAEARANSYPQVLTSDRLARLVIDRTGVNLSPRELAGRISGSVELNTITVTATVQDTSKARATLIARAVAVEFPTLVDTLDNRGQSPKSVVIDVLSGPNAPAQVSPRENLNIALGLAAGLVLGLIIAALRELLDTNVRTVSGAEEIIGKPALGTIPFDSATADSPLIIGEQATTSRAEAMRQIRTNLQFVDVDTPPHVIVVTSSTAVEGKSTTATNLALAFAETESRVVLVEGDLRRPKVTDYTGIERAVGLSNVLAGQVELDDVLQPFGEKLQVLPSGPTPPNAAAMVGSARMAALVADLRDRFDIVIIDTPPLLPVTDAALLATLADGVLIVLRYGRVSRVQLATMCRSLEAVNAPVVGFALNMIPKRQARQYGGRYDGYYRDEDTAAATLPALEEPALEEPALEEPALEEPTLEEPTLEEPTLEEAEVVPPAVAESVDRGRASRRARGRRAVVAPPEPVAEGEPEPTVQPVAEDDAAPVVEPEPVDPEPVAEPEPEPEPVVEVEPEAKSEAEPDLVDELLDEPESAAEDEPVEPVDDEPVESESKAKRARRRTRVRQSGRHHRSDSTPTVGEQLSIDDQPEPEVVEAEVVEAEVVEPEVVEPEVVEPEVVEPDFFEPVTADPEAGAPADEQPDEPVEPADDQVEQQAAEPTDEPTDERGESFSKPPPGARPARKRTNGRSKSGSGRRR